MFRQLGTSGETVGNGCIVAKWCLGFPLSWRNMGEGISVNHFSIELLADVSEPDTRYCTMNLKSFSSFFENSEKFIGIKF